MPSAQHPSIGFQAIILCGPGAGLYPFTQDEDLPKALLPVANKPMLHYPLEWCEKAGFDSILVLALTEHLSPIQSFLRSHRHPKSTIPISVEAASSLNDNLGSADVLRVAYAKGWITSDFCVLPCDFVSTLPPTLLPELYMTTLASFDSDLGRRARRSRTAPDALDNRRGALAVFYQTMGEGAVKGQETDWLVMEPLCDTKVTANGIPEGDVGVLLTTAPGSGLKGVVNVDVRHGMVKRHGQLRMYTTYRDAGVYFLPYWVLRFIEKNPALSSIREDVLPWLAKSRWQNERLARKLGLEEILNGEKQSEDGAEEEEAEQEMYDIGSMSTTRIRRPEDARAEFKREDVPPVVVYAPKEGEVFIRRVDTTQLYLFTSLHLAKADPATTTKIDASAHIAEKAVVTTQDCLVAEKASVGEKCVVKKSVLGAGVSIGRGARIMGCVLMDGASVAENAKLEGCTIGRKANIGAKVNLKDCEVADGYFLEDGVEAKGERFVTFEGLEADAEDPDALLDSDEYESGSDDDGDYDESGDGKGDTEQDDGAVFSGDEGVKKGKAQ